MQSQTLSSQYDATSMDELTSLCSYIDVHNRHEKILRYLKDIYSHSDIHWDGDKFHGIKLSNKTISTIDDLKEATIFLSDPPQVHIGDNKHQATMVCSSDCIYRIDLERKELSYKGISYSFKSQPDFITKLANLQSSASCQSCDNIIPPKAYNRHQCKQCIRREQRRLKSATKVGARKALTDLSNSLNPQFADHLSNQLQLQCQDSSSNTAYNKG